MTVGALPWLLAVGGLSQASPADPTPISIEFDSPAGCSSAESFYQGIRSRTLKVKLAQEGEPVSVVRIRLFRAGTKIKGELTLSDQEGEKETRKVDGATCDEVVEALALTVTLALDPDAIFSRATPAEAQTPSVVSKPPLQPLPPVPPMPKQEQSARSHWELGVRFGVASVVVPGLSMGPSVRGSYLSDAGPYSVGLLLSVLRNDVAGTPKYGEFGLISASLELCPFRTRPGAAAEFGLCALGNGGWLSAKGIALDRPLTSGRTFWEAGLRGLGALRVRGQVYLGFYAGATVPLVRREFTEKFTEFGQAETVAHTPAVALHAGLGFDYRF